MNIFDKTFMIIIDKIIYFINQIPVTILGLLMLIIVIGTGLSCAIKKWNAGYSSDGDDYWM